MTILCNLKILTHWQWHQNDREILTDKNDNEKITNDNDRRHALSLLFFIDLSHFVCQFFQLSLSCHCHELENFTLLLCHWHQLDMTMSTSWYVIFWSKFLISLYVTVKILTSQSQNFWQCHVIWHDRPHVISTLNRLEMS